MRHHIISDSCVDFSEKNPDQFGDIARVPFKITVGEEEMEDRDLDTFALLSKMKAYTGKISTACPSPYDFYSTFKSAAVNFVVTISSKLSGSYQSAAVAKEMFEEEEEDGESSVHLIDSQSASAGQNLIILKLKSLLEQNLEAEQILSKINEYVENMKTLFLPVSVDNLERNGRISGIKAKIGKALHVVPILGSNGRGELVLKDWAIGEKQAVKKLFEMIAASASDIKESILTITHVDAAEKAEKIKEALLEQLHFKEIMILRAGGLSTVYADMGGLVFAFR